MNRAALFSVVVALGMFAAAPAARAADRLTGVWNVTVTPNERGREFKDVVTFKAEKISSAYFAKKGFKPVMYDEDTRGIQQVTFKAIQESKDEGTLTWNGQVTASGELTGDLKWTHKGGAENTYTFKGERKIEKRK